MLVRFNDLPETSKVWIYQSDQQLIEEHIAYIKEEAAHFCETWAAHGTPLHSSFRIMHNKFIVLAVDEGFNMASGCSIDSSVRFVKGLENKLGVNFFDRTQVAFLIDDHVYTTPLKAIKNEIVNGKIEPDTLTFNIQAQSLADFNSNWLIKAQSSWMKRYF